MVWLWLGAILGVLFFTPPAGAYDNSPVINLFVTRSLPFDDWYAADRAHVEAVTRQYGRNREALQAKMLYEWEIITRELERTLAGGYFDAKRCFAVYSRNCSGKIHVLGLAKYCRESILENLVCSNARFNVYPSLLAGAGEAGIPTIENRDFKPVNAADSYTVEEVITLVNDIKAPEEVFKGIAFYLLPYDIDGYAAFTYSQGLPGHEEAVYISAARSQAGQPGLATVLTHELGHCVHCQCIGSYEANPAAWEQFLRLIGQERYEEDYEKYWHMTDENFAEYFRMVYGSPAARQPLAFQGAYRNPAASPYLRDAYRSFLERLAAEGNQGFFDLASLSVTLTGPRGAKFSLPVGPRPEQVNTVVTAGPRVVLSAQMDPGSAASSLVPVGACSRAGEVPKPGDYKPLMVKDGGVSFEVNLSQPGSYYIYLGQAGRQMEAKSLLRFKVIYPG